MSRIKDETQNEIIVNMEKNRFEVVIKGLVSFVNFKEDGDVVELTHVEVPESLRHQGFGAGLMQSVMEHLKNADKRAKPICPFAMSFLKNNPHWYNRVVINLDNH